jgi:acetyl-CoA synthetase
LLGSVGEPMDAETWDWYFTKVGKQKCPILDTWWQTETGGIMLSQMPQTVTWKCGDEVKPMFGIQPDLVDDDEKLTTELVGNLVIKEPWPGQMLTIYNDEKRFEDTYFTSCKNGGFYLAGDRALYNEKGALRVTGRSDDTLNVAGHLIGATEIEAALIKHEAVAEAAVVGYPHPIKGQGIYAYVALINEYQPDEIMIGELLELVKTEISGIAKPDVLHWTPELPKTRSGKVMRRILRKISNNEFDDVGDTSTLINPSIVQYLITSRSQYGV